MRSKKMDYNELKEAVEFTSQQTGFPARLIEKDYYCSLILKSLYSQDNLKNQLIFKGGTLIAKSYTDFFRLSEDLDFSVRNEIALTRASRKRFAETIRKFIIILTKDLQLSLISDFKGFNESKQYNAIFQYTSYIGLPETIKFEIGLRNDMVQEPQLIKLKTLLTHALTGQSVIPHIEILGLSLEETYAEKFRAALSRKEPAIRDFFDIWQAKTQNLLPETEEFYTLIKAKLKNDNASLNMDSTKKLILQNQIQHELNSVLKEEIAKIFDFADAWNIALNICNRIV